MTTPSDIVTRALKSAGVLGVGQIALAEDVNDAYTALNMMMAQWNRKRWLVYQLVELSVASTGAQYYTIGPSLGTAPADQPDIVWPLRPDRLEGAFVRLVSNPAQPVDTVVDIFESMTDYSRVVLKQLVSVPTAVFYDPGYPWGKIYPVPIAQAALYSVHVLVKQELRQFTSLNQTVQLPPEYDAALVFNLAGRLKQMYQMPPDPKLEMLSMDALDIIRGSTTQIGRLSMPDGLVHPGVYNPYSDSVR